MLHFSSRKSGISISPTNAVETNYKKFYELYITFSLDAGTREDSTELFGLASLCPALNGACIYKARALYNTTYKSPEIFADDCGRFGARTKAFKSSSINKKTWHIQLFTNPAVNIVTIKSNRNTEDLKVEITDLAGRMLMKKDLKIENFNSTLELSLVNGAYTISITNAEHEKVVKKLLISK